MSQDLKISSKECNFKFRVNGIIINNNKILTVKINSSNFYCLPGGHVEIGEDSKTAIIREIKEEIKIDVNILNLVSLAENFFESENNQKFHELSLYYLLEPKNNINLVDYKTIEHDKDKDKNTILNFKWYDLNNLEYINFKPSFLIEKLAQKNFDFSHIIFKQQEKM